MEEKVDGGSSAEARGRRSRGLQGRYALKVVPRQWDRNVNLAEILFGIVLTLAGIARIYDPVFL